MTRNVPIRRRRCDWDINFVLIAKRLESIIAIFYHMKYLLIIFDEIVILDLFTLNSSSSGEKIGNPDILFLVGGITQVIWVIPIIRQWGKNMVFYRYSRNSSLYVIMDNY